MADMTDTIIAVIKGGSADLDRIAEAIEAARNASHAQEPYLALVEGMDRLQRDFDSLAEEKGQIEAERDALLGSALNDVNLGTVVAIHAIKGGRCLQDFAQVRTIPEYADHLVYAVARDDLTENHGITGVDPKHGRVSMGPGRAIKIGG